MEIKDFPNYLIFRNGAVLNIKKKLFLKQSIDTPGYIYVRLTNDSGIKPYRIHRLLAIHYIPNPHNYLEVDHIDRNIKNFNLNNLRWISNVGNKFNTNMQINNKCGIKNICCQKYQTWHYKKMFRGLEFRYTNKNKQLVLWVKFVHTLKIKRYLNL